MTGTQQYCTGTHIVTAHLCSHIWSALPTVCLSCCVNWDDCGSGQLSCADLRLLVLSVDIGFLLERQISIWESSPWMTALPWQDSKVLVNGERVMGPVAEQLGYNQTR